MTRRASHSSGLGTRQMSLPSCASSMLAGSSERRVLGLWFTSLVSQAEKQGGRRSRFVEECLHNFSSEQCAATNLSDVTMKHSAEQSSFFQGVMRQGCGSHVAGMMEGCGRDAAVMCQECGSNVAAMWELHGM